MGGWRRLQAAGHELGLKASIGDRRPALPAAFGGGGARAWSHGKGGRTGRLGGPHWYGVVFWTSGLLVSAVLRERGARGVGVLSFELYKRVGKGGYMLK